MSKRKTGKRGKDGRVIRSQTNAAKAAKANATTGRCSDWVEAQHARFGDHYTTALGRAYAAGLLRDPVDDRRAAERLQAAERYGQVQERFFGKSSCGRNPLDNSPRGGVDPVAEITPQQVVDREWYRQNVVRVAWTDCGKYLAQLLSVDFVHYGPAWLDVLLDNKPENWPRQALMSLQQALRAIDAIQPVHVARVERFGLAA